MEIFMKRILSFLLIIVVSAIVSFFVSTSDFSDNNNFSFNKLSRHSEAPPNSVIAENDIPSVSERVIPTVVGISSSIDNRSLFSPSQSETWSMGSGVIVSSDGYILTNHHVIENATKSYVTLKDGQSLSASYIWSDKNLDIAIIKIDAQNLTFAALGDSSALRVGESVIAIGNPLSLQFQRTVTAGIVSALNRTIALSENGETTYMEDLIQTDASINSGNSGGPLINSSGEVIGINTIKVTTAEGMGFAIPINITRPIIDKIIKEGRFETPYLGLYAYDKEIAQYVIGSFPSDEGIYVAQVDFHGPAYVAGIREGDIITEVSSAKITSMLSLREQLFYHKPGDSIQIRILRDGKSKTINVSLSNA